MLGIPFAVFQLIWLFFQKRLIQNIYAPIFIAVVLTFYLVPIITNYTELNYSNNFLPHLLVLVVIITAFVFLNILDKKLLPFLNIAILAILVFLNIYENEENKKSIQKVTIDKGKMNPAETFFSDKKIKHTPDIYLLIYDAYVEEEQMRTLYNIDNSKQMNFF